jgi:uncharacterized protein
MKYAFVAVLLLFTGMSISAQSDNPAYDKAAADSLGGDDYGMKMYVLVILKTGDKTAEKKVQDSLFAGHMTNIQKLAAEKKLIVAGPLVKNDKTYRGIFILNVKKIEEANILLASDPAIAYGLLSAELYQWYGSAALPVYLPMHDKIQKKTM